jgi:hypothetical protein
MLVGHWVLELGITEQTSNITGRVMLKRQFKTGLRVFAAADWNKDLDHHASVFCFESR